MSNSCLACFGCLLVLVVLACFGIIPYIGIETCSWLSDFEDWADDVDDLVSSTGVTCTNEAKLYSLIDDIDTFITITYLFTGAGIYYALIFCAMSCNAFFKSELVHVCSKPKCAGLNFLIHNVASIVFIWQYFFMKNLLNNINNNNTSCGIGYQYILGESKTYYDHLTSFPTQYILHVYIIEVVSLCAVACIFAQMDDDSNSSSNNKSGKSTYATSQAASSHRIEMGTAGARRTAGVTGTSNSRAVVVANRGNDNERGLADMFGAAGARAAAGGRDRTDSEQQAVMLLGAIVFTAYGFEFATEKNCNDAMTKLARQRCGNQTALRDAIALGIGRMVKLKNHLTRLNAFDHNFIHIVLTDGEDNKSEIEKTEFLALQHILDREQFHKVCKTIFIGVELSNTAERELKLYSILGGEHAQFEKCNAMDIESIFDHISINLIQRTRIAAVQTNNGAVMFGSRERAAVLGLNHFLVLFTLDISGSMAGSRWNAVKRAVKSLLNNLKSSDIFGIVLFNDKTKMITGVQDDD